MRSFLVIQDNGSDRVSVKDADWQQVEAKDHREAGAIFAGRFLKGSGDFTIHVRPSTSKPPCVVHTLTVRRTEKGKPVCQ